MDPLNYYENKANRKFLNEKNKTSKDKSEQLEEKPEKWRETLDGVATDTIVGVLGGGLMAATIGKPAFLVGLAISGYGHYAKNKTLSALGLGMMASGTMSALNGKKQVPTLPERLKEFKEELKRKLFLDKLLLVIKKDTLNGIEQPKEKEIVPITPPDASDFLSMEEIEKSDLNNIPDSELDGPIQKNDNRLNLDDFDDWKTNGRIY